MKEYQISVSIGGKFLFRTDWMDDPEQQMKGIAILLDTALNKVCDYKPEVTLYARNKVMQSIAY